MKHLYLLVFVILLGNLCGFAQDYQTVRSGRIAFFNNDQGKIKCIRIDSVSLGRDSVMYPMPEIQQTGYDCFNPQGNSWIGKIVVIQSNGFELFFNNNNDIIFINTKAKLNETWNVFNIEDSIKVVGEIISVGMQTILDESDSIKTIGLKVYDKNGLVAHHYLSEKSIVLSKNHGLVKMMNFNLFPKEPNSMSSEILETFELAGLTNPKLGVQNLTWLGVHDHQIGDELHVISNSWDWSGVPGYRYELKTIWKFLERKESKDSVFYRIERKESLKKSIERWDNNTYSFTHDTITQVYKPDSIFDKLPGEPIISDFGADVNVMFNERDFIKKYNSYQPLSNSSEESCWHQIMYDGEGSNYYLQGLGGPYYLWNEIIKGEDRTLIYCKKGAITLGTPLIITDVESVELNEEIGIYPNPADDFVKIKNISGRKEKYEISLTDMQGREIFRNEAEISNTYQLDVTSFKEGAYLLKLQNGKKQITRMIIKK